MQILVDPGHYDCKNMGCVAMLQSAVTRLRVIWPSARIRVFTEAPDALARYCERVEAVSIAGVRDYLADHYLFGRIHQLVPESASERLINLTRNVQQRWPALVDTATRVRTDVRGGDRRSFDAYLDAIYSSDLLVVSGGGGLNDWFPRNTRLVLSTLERAIAQGTPAVMVGQGIGPIHGEKLRTRFKTTLPLVDLIALRESRAGVPLLRDLGVADAQVMTTGDDAIEMAYDARPRKSGDAIGVTLRVSPSAEVSEDVIAILRPVLQDFARRHETTLIPVPITFTHGIEDTKFIQQLLEGFVPSGDGGESLNTPLKVIEQVGRCRIVVTGAYHAAVFALSQGVPAICLSNSTYYADKLLGLAEQFGTGCEVLSLSSGRIAAELAEAMGRAWQSADEVRTSLLDAAVRQIRVGWVMYERIKETVESRRVVNKGLGYRRSG